MQVNVQKATPKKKPHNTTFFYLSLICPCEYFFFFLVRVFRQVFYTMAGVVDGVISTKGSPTLAEFETLLAEEDAKFQIMTSPSSEKPNQHS